MLKEVICTSIFITSIGSSAIASNQIRAAGSSTVYPFVTVAAEEFGRSGQFKTPIIESTGTGGGFKLFCEGVGEQTTDLANASRPIKQSEREQCTNNGVKDITEIKIGYDGIVLANTLGAEKMDLTQEQLFKALAKMVPSDGKLIANPNKKWNDIDPSLPANDIEIYGPPPTSGTRDAFVELIMEHACENFTEFKAAYPDKKALKEACHAIREDGVFIETGENDNLIVQKISNNDKALGIFGFSFLDQNSSYVQGAKISGVEPTFENISDGSYPVSRPLYVYLKDAHLDKTPGLREFAKELVSSKAIGEEGYLIDKGLIPLSDEEFANISEAVNSK